MVCPKNDTTDQINAFVTNQIPSEAKILLSADSVDSQSSIIYLLHISKYCISISIYTFILNTMIISLSAHYFGTVRATDFGRE